MSNRHELDYVSNKVARVYVDAQSGNTDAAKLAAALSAASSFGGIVELPDRALDVGTTFSMSGYSCGLVGAGSSYLRSGSAYRSVIKATQQAGPVLDFTGFAWPDSSLGRIEIGMFAVVGSGVADPTLANIGVRISSATAAATGVWFHDITISGTGGPCMDTGIIYLSSVDRIIMSTPVGANLNNVPYFIARSPNCTTFNGLGFRSPTAGGFDTGSGGALVVVSDGNGSAAGEAVFNDPWFENLHVANGGTLISNTGNGLVYNDVLFVDTAKDTGASGTSFVRFNAPTVGNDIGGNIWRGAVPGNGGAANSVDVGIDMRQSRNYVTGTKGYKGTNLTLAAGVGYTTAVLSGEASGATAVAFADNSAQTTNVLIDNTAPSAVIGTYQRTGMASGNGGAGPMFVDYQTPANGAMWLGNGGGRIQAVGKGGYLTFDSLTIRNTALSGAPGITLGVGAAPRINTGTGVPTIAAPIGSIYLRTDGGATSTLYVKESGTDGTGWIAK